MNDSSPHRQRSERHMDDSVDRVTFSNGNTQLNGRAKTRNGNKDHGPVSRVMGTAMKDVFADTMTDSEVEDYDHQEPDPASVIKDSHALGSVTELDHKYGTAELDDEDRPSIPINLERTEEKGRYLLTADDPDLRDILRRVLDKDKQRKSPFGPPPSSLEKIVFTRRFTAFDRANPESNDSPFHGFFTLFWICMFIMFVKIAAENWRTYGSVLGNHELYDLMFSREVFVMALTDGVMVGSTGVGYLMQIAVVKGWIDWASYGFALQHIWQTFWIISLLGWTIIRDWPWSHTIFIVLHGLCYLMKQHSYAAYNGYLSQVYHRRNALQKKYGQLIAMAPAQSSNSISKSRMELNSDAEDSAIESRDKPMHPGLRRRLTSRGQTASTSDSTIPLTEDSTEINSIVAALSSKQPLNREQVHFFKRIIATELEALNLELQGKCQLTKSYYPSNLTISNFLDWSVLPTLVYELEYPRQDKISWSYIAEKTAATFGCLAIMQVISQAYIYPLVIETMRMKEAGMSVRDRWQEFPWVLLDLLFPILLEHLLSWYVIWECVLNVVAELTGFADRGFYGAWWNCVSFAEYARDWNKPVHNFLLRHVYHSSISAFRLSKTTAMLMTFVLSALVHELLMFCLFKKFRGYLFTMQLLQLPLAALSRMKWLRERRVLGNTLFWFGIFLGPSLITSLYLVI